VRYLIWFFHISSIPYLMRTLKRVSIILDIITSEKEEVIIKVADFKNAVLTWLSTLPKYLQQLLGVSIPAN